MVAYIALIKRIWRGNKIFRISVCRLWEKGFGMSDDVWVVMLNGEEMGGLSKKFQFYS